MISARSRTRPPSAGHYAFRFVAGLALTGAGCASPSEALGPAGDDGSSTGGEDSSPFPTTSIDSGATSAEAGDGDAECVVHEDCEGDAPFCLDGVCAACDAYADPDTACGERDSRAPLCSGGVCVECDEAHLDLCGDDAPVCDANNTCSGCTSHEQCEAGCSLATGRCLEDRIVVDAGGGGDFETLSEAVTAVDAGGSAAIIVVPAAQCYVESIAIDEAREVAIIGQDGQKPCLTSWEFAPVVAVRGQSAAYLQDVRVTRAVGVGIEAAGSHVWLSDSEIVSNDGGGIHVGQGSELRVANSLVGGDRSHVAAIDVEASDATIVYSTIAAGFGSARALSCRGSGSFAVRNSILVAESDAGEVDCEGATIETSALESAWGDGNVAVGAIDAAAWFVDFAGGDLHLRPEATAAMFSGVARWAEGDPAYDIDGDPRPSMSGMSDWCGGDVP